jgi:hypothetical protein
LRSYQAANLLGEPTALGRVADWILPAIEIKGPNAGRGASRICRLRKEPGLAASIGRLAARYDKSSDLNNPKQASRLAIAAVILGHDELLKEILGGGGQWTPAFLRELQAWLKENAGNTGLIDGKMWPYGPAATALDRLIKNYNLKPC